MAAKVPVAVRLDPAVLEWVDGYVAERGVSRQVWIESAVDAFADDCMRGVPELRAAVRRQSYARDEEAGVGDCPRRGDGLGHVFRPASEDESRPCRFCGLGGRASRPVSDKPGPPAPANFLDESTAERAAMFSRLRVSMVSGSGKVPGSK